MVKGANAGRSRYGPVSGGDSTNGGGFDTFFRTEYVRLVRLICGAGGTREEAEDAAATAMTSAYRSWTALTNPGAWVRTTALRYYVRRPDRTRPFHSDIHRNDPYQAATTTIQTSATGWCGCCEPCRQRNWR